MKTNLLIPFTIFIRAIGLYMLFTIPAIAIPFIYAYSAFLAIVFGSAGGFIFLGFYTLLGRSRLAYRSKYNLLLLFVLASVSLSYFLIGIFDAADNMWGFNLFLVFPGIAVIAGWASLFISRKAIKAHLDPDEDEIELLLKP